MDSTGTRVAHDLGMNQSLFPETSPLRSDEQSSRLLASTDEAAKPEPSTDEETEKYDTSTMACTD